MGLCLGLYDSPREGGVLMSEVPLRLDSKTCPLVSGIASRGRCKAAIPLRRNALGLWESRRALVEPFMLHQALVLCLNYQFALITTLA